MRGFVDQEYYRAWADQVVGELLYLFHSETFFN